MDARSRAFRDAHNRRPRVRIIPARVRKFKCTFREAGLLPTSTRSRSERTERAARAVSQSASHSQVNSRSGRGTRQRKYPKQLCATDSFSHLNTTLAYRIRVGAR